MSVVSDLERWAWGATAIIGGALVVACVRPAFELAVEAGSDLGTGVYRYEEVVNIAWDAGAIGISFLLAGVVVAAAGVAVAAGLVPRSGPARPLLAAAMLLVSLVLLAALGFGTGGVTRWSDDATVYSEQDAGPLIEAAVARLRERAEVSSDAAQDPTWRLDGKDRFGLARRGGETLLFLASVGLFWIAGYRVARLRLSRLIALLAVAAVTLAALVLSIVELLDHLE